MCELMIRAEDQLDRDEPGRLWGDVLEIVDDGHEWSPLELAAPQYQMLRLRGIDKEQLMHLRTGLSTAGRGHPIAARALGLTRDTLVGRLLELTPVDQIPEIRGQGVLAVLEEISQRSAPERL